MTFDNIPAGLAGFVDANCLICDATLDPTYGPACKRLLERVENKGLTGYTSAAVLAEVSHRLMTIEAMQAFGWKSAGIALRLRNHPIQVQTLKRFRQAIQEIPLLAIRILSVDPAWLDSAAAISQQTGLMHNDALLIAAMRAQITDPAGDTHDKSLWGKGVVNDVLSFP